MWRASARPTATVINVGISKLGGPTAAVQAAQLGAGGGVRVMVGSVIDMGIATAMGLHLVAALPMATRTRSAASAPVLAAGHAGHHAPRAHRRTPSPA